MAARFPKLRQPIVLIHGYGAVKKYGPIDYFFKIPQLLEDSGNRVLVADLAAWRGIDHRAEQLKSQIEQFTQEKVNLIGHSMGGLDARYVVSRLGFAEHVASVTTVGTPNRGTVLADLGASLIPDGSLELLQQIQGWKQMSGTHGKEILDSLIDSPGVRYFSATTRITDPVRKSALPIFWIPDRIIRALEGDNDGFVSVRSAIWGEHICTWDGDHYAQIGQILGRTRGLDYLGFWRTILCALMQAGL